MIRVETYFRIITGAILLLLLCYIAPVFPGADPDFRTTFAQLSAGISGILARSTLFAFLTSVFCVTIAMTVAFALRRAVVNSRNGRILALLIIPFLIGETSAAFIFKMLLLNSSLMEWAYQEPVRILTVIAFIQAWQYTSLFIYLFFLSFKSVSPRLTQYSQAFGFSNWEYFKDICLPSMKNQITLFALIIFIYSFYEDVKISLIFKVSEGLNAELASHWLYRNFQSDLLISYNYALHNTFIRSAGLFLLIAFTSTLTGLLLAFLINRLKQSPFVLKSKSAFKSTGSATISLRTFILATVLVCPMVLVFFKVPIQAADGSYLSSPLLLSIPAALLASIIAVIFSFVARMTHIQQMASFTSYSYAFLILLFGILFIPPLLIMLAGFQWMSSLHMAGIASTVFFWLVGHGLLLLPILSGFLIVTYFQVSAGELYYCRIYLIGRKDLFYRNFFQRFKAEYLLTFLFAYTLIMNEGLLNKVFSDRIPSFTAVLNESISSKSSDYSVSMLFFLISLLMAAGCILIWNYSIKRNQDAKNIG